MKFEHKGVIANISCEAIRDAQECEGINLPHLIANAIDRMLYVADKEKGDFKVAVHIHNPSCDPTSCDFHIKIFRIEHQHSESQ